MSLIAAFDIPVGSMALTIPAGTRRVPGILWDNMALAALLDQEGYQAIAREQLGRLDAWLRVPDPVALRWPGDEAERPKGRKLLDEVREGDAGLKWYVVRAATRQEERAEKGLVEAGFPVYVPRLIRWQRLAKRKKRVEQALIPGYLFVGVSRERSQHDEDLQHIMAIEGVHNLVRLTPDRPPVAAPFLEIFRILSQEQAGEFDRTRKAKARPDPEPGESVMVIAGGFQGFPAQFVKRRPDQRLELLINMFGRWSTIVMKPQQVEGFAPDEE